VAHLIIDSGVDTEFVRDRYEKRGINPDELSQPPPHEARLSGRNLLDVASAKTRWADS
jgi:hypothetical protein